MNDVDYNSKKKIKETDDKMEIERCLMELVGWVAEQSSNNVYNDKLVQLNDNT